MKKFDILFQFLFFLLRFKFFARKKISLIFCDNMLSTVLADNFVQLKDSYLSIKPDDKKGILATALLDT